MPVTRNAQRHRLVRLLHESGFAKLSASSWVSPYDWRDFLSAILSESPYEGDFHCLRCTEITSPRGGPPPSPAKLWDLKDLSARYERIRQACSGTPKGHSHNEQQARARALFAARRQLAAAERQDPMLPRELLPSGWPRGPTLRRVEVLRAQVQKDAEARAARPAQT
jgi:DNA-binding transcriptional regulator PaaX